MSPARTAVGIALCAACEAFAACVAFDPNGPAVPGLAGRYEAVISIHYHSEFEHWWDTVTATVSLPDAKPHRLFSGSYVTAQGETGVVAGELRPDGTMLVTKFGQPALTTLEGATFLHRLYPWCDFRTIGTGDLAGEIRGDTLVIAGGASVFCQYFIWTGFHDIRADLDVRLVGVR